MLLSKKTIRTLGIIFTTLALIFAIIAIILAAIQYRFAGPGFVDNSFKSVPATQIATIVFSFFVIILSFIAFAKPNMKFSLAVAVLMLLSLLFNLAIAIYSFVAANTGWVNTNHMCTGEYNGVIGVFNNIDTYLQQIDQDFCSNSCPCFFTNITSFNSNTTLKPYYDLWTKTNVAGPVAFQNCSSVLQDYTFNQAQTRDAAFKAKPNFDRETFYEYMARVEREFDCSGWCQISYYNPNYKQNVQMAKYLFTDINRGPPRYFGCMNELIQWLPGYLNAWGSMTMLLFGTQIALLSLLICQYYAREKDHEKQIPHHHDDARQ